MGDEPEWGIRRDDLGVHSLSRLEYEVRDGEVVYMDGGDRTGHGDRRALRTRERTHPARSQRGAHRRLRDRLRDPQSHLDLQVHRYDSAGRGLPRPTGPAGRRRRTRACPGRWTGPQHRRAGCGEPGMEAGPGGQPDIAGKPPGYLPCRAPPGRCPGAAQHNGGRSRYAARTPARRPCAPPCPSSSAWTSRAHDSPR